MATIPLHGMPCSETYYLKMAPRGPRISSEECKLLGKVTRRAEADFKETVTMVRDGS